MPEKKHHSDDGTRHLPSPFPPVAPSSALTDPPGHEEAQRDEVHEEHFPSGYCLWCDGIVSHPCRSVEVDVKKQDDDGEEDGYEDGHPTQDVQERSHDSTQSTNQDKTRVDRKSMEEIFDELEDFPRGLVIWGSPRQRANPVLVYVQMIPCKHLVKIKMLISENRKMRMD